MNILILGNGFDLAHGLETSYLDFLYACCKINNKEFKGYKLLNGKKVPYASTLADDKVEECLGLYKSEIGNNCWINYFLDKIETMQPSWIDFEREIYSCCKIFYKRISSPYGNLSSEENSIMAKFHNGFIENAPLNDIMSTIQTMKNDLNKLKSILNSYLNGITKSDSKKFLNELIDYKPDYVLNYNYTDTYKKIYYPDCTMDFPHGQLTTSNNENTLILGFNSIGDIKGDIKFAEFLKYFQMVKNTIEISLFDLLNKSRDQFINVDIFGLSLDINDSDLLLPIIEKANAVNIYYYSKGDLAGKIKNLMEMFGTKEKFINYCIGKDKSIHFIEQQQAIIKPSEIKFIKTHLRYSKPSNNEKYRILSKREYREILDYCIKDPFRLSTQNYAFLLFKLLQSFVVHSKQKFEFNSKKFEKLMNKIRQKYESWDELYDWLPEDVQDQVNCFKDFPDEYNLFKNLSKLVF